MKKDLKKISSLIHNNPSYKDIEDRLDFNGLQIESKPKQFRTIKPIISNAWWIIKKKKKTSSLL